MNTEPIAEKDLARRLNISRDILRKLRHELLEPDVDFTIAANNGMVMLTPSGVIKIQERLNASSPPVEGAQQSLERAVSAPEPAPAPAEIHTFYVQATHPRVLNTRILIATRDPELKKERVTIRVRDNRLYAVRTAIYATQSGDTPVYNVFGRPPRWRGQKLPIPPELALQQAEQAAKAALTTQNQTITPAV